MADAQIPAAVAGTPLGERVAWLIDRLRGGAEIEDAELDAHFATNQLRRDVVRTQLDAAGKSLAGCVVREVRALNTAVAVISFSPGERTYDVGIRIEREAPHRIRGISHAERLPGVAIRTATDADAGALRTLELQTPIELGDARVVYDRGDDYFGAERLMGNAITQIVELEGRPVGLAAWVEHPIRVNGATLVGGFKHRQRLLPEVRGTGVRQMQDVASLEVTSAERDVFYTYTAVGNAAVRKAYGEPRWSVHPERIVIDTKAHAGADAGRLATAADGARIVELLNGTHQREEMYVPYTPESLAARLGREPSLYSWPQMRLGERAVVGVWPAHLNVIHTRGGETTTDDRALVLDYGYEAGAEAEFVELLRAECAALAHDGATELSIFVAAQSPVYDRVAAMAKRIDEYLLYLPMPPPADLAERGVYVDQLYF